MLQTLPIWPTELVAESLGPITATPLPAGNGSGSSGGGHSTTLSTGAIVGIAIGGAVVLCGIAALLWILLRRKRRNGSGGNKSYGAEGKLDMLAPVMSEEDKEAPPAVTPFQHTTSFSGVPTQGYAQTQAWPTPHPTGDAAFTPAAFEESNAGGSYYQDAGYSQPMSSASQSDPWQSQSSDNISLASGGYGAAPYLTPQTLPSAGSEKARLTQTYAGGSTNSGPSGPSGDGFTLAPTSVASVSGQTGAESESGQVGGMSSQPTTYVRHADAGSVDDHETPQPQGGVGGSPADV